MTDYCAPAVQSAGFVSSTLSFIDCQAQVLGMGGWSALAAPGSTLAVVLQGFLTIFIAIIGYELLLGGSVTLRAGTLAMLKIGMIFALATSWPAYQVLVYNLAMDAPRQLAAEIGPASGIVGSDGTLTQRLDAIDAGLSRLALLGPGYDAALDSQTPPPPFAGFDAFALGGARLLYLIVAVGCLAAVRVLTGLLLALGPFFIAFAMFDATRGWFEGWVRVLAGSALASLGLLMALGLELALLEPWVATAIAQRTGGQALPSLPEQLFVIAFLGALMSAACAWGGMRLAGAFRLPLILANRNRAPKSASSARLPAQRSSAALYEGQAVRERATIVARFLQHSSRRDMERSGTTRRAQFGMRQGAGDKGQEFARSAPIGQTFRRRSASRVSSIASRRDLRR